MPSMQIFLSYEAADIEFRDALVSHLAALILSGQVTVWHDGLLPAGSEWEQETLSQLERSQIVLLLVSSHYIASCLTYAEDLELAIRRHKAGFSRVIPVLLRHCDWSGMPFSGLAWLPASGNPIERIDNHRAFKELVDEIRERLPVLKPPYFERQPQPLPPPYKPMRPRNSFWGRQQEVRRLKELLGCCKGLVTVTGPGGIGKSRLVQEVLYSLVEAWDRAVWYVQLTNVTDPELIPAAILEILEIPRAPNMAAVDQICELLDNRRALLALDGIEQLAPNAARVIEELLTYACNLTCLVVTRQQLGLEGEQVFALKPLLLPNVNMELEALKSIESIQLFVDRARASCHQFELTPENASDVTAIVQRLEGIPLALELAAARAIVLEMGEILERLNNRFAFLVSRRGDFRQRSLLATLDWSYDLLSIDVQRFFVSLSVFRGGWWLHNAEKVTGESGTVLFLEELCKSSLVMVEETAQGRHFRMLETIREYGERRLLDSQREPLKRRHASYFLSFALQAEPKLLSELSHQWLTWLEMDQQNIRAAIEWSLGPTGDPLIGISLASCLTQFYLRSGRLEEGYKALESLTKMPPVQKTTFELARGLNGMSTLAYARGDCMQAKKLAEDVLVLPLGPEHEDERAVARNNLGLALTMQGDYRRAEHVFEVSLDMALAHRNRRNEALAINNLGIVAYRRGDLARARYCYHASLQMKRQVGEKRGAAFSLTNLGRVAMMEDDYESARTFQLEAVEIARQLRDWRLLAGSLLNLADTLIQLKALKEANSAASESLALYETVRDQSGIANAKLSIGVVCSLEGNPAAACNHLLESLNIFDRLRSRSDAVECVEQLAMLDHVLGKPRSAVRLISTATSERELLGTPRHRPDQALIDQTLEQIRAVIGDVHFAAAWDDARHNSFDHNVNQRLIESGRR